MKEYIIKITGTDIYVKALAFGGEPFIKTITAFCKEDAGIYEEDKAKKYVKLLNEENKDRALFELEKIEKIER